MVSRKYFIWHAGTRTEQKQSHIEKKTIDLWLNNLFKELVL